jgi:imidazolonepropionase
LIADFGSMDSVPKVKADKTIDATGKWSYRLVRQSPTLFKAIEQEFVDRINGLSYEEIANRGGGILNSAKSSTKPKKSIINLKSA